MRHRHHEWHCHAGHSPRRRFGFGLFVILIGVLALLNNLGVFSALGVVQFWPVFFILLGGMLCIRHGGISRLIAGGSFIALGGLLILKQAGYLVFNPYDLWPLALIAAGGMVLARGFAPRWRYRYHQRETDDYDIGDLKEEARSWFKRRKHVQTGPFDETGNSVSATVVMSASKQSFSSPDFRGGNVSVLMGGMELDLRQAAMQTDAVLNVDILLGGLEIKVPQGWNVQIESSPLMGAVDHKIGPANQGQPRLILRGSVVLGGVEIRH